MPRNVDPDSSCFAASFRVTGNLQNSRLARGNRNYRRARRVLTRRGLSPIWKRGDDSCAWCSFRIAGGCDADAERCAVVSAATGQPDAPPPLAQAPRRWTIARWSIGTWSATTCASHASARTRPGPGFRTRFPANADFDRRKQKRARLRARSDAIFGLNLVSARDRADFLSPHARTPRRCS